ncbi:MULTISPECIES: ABC transporter permease [unclassified Vibrio]|uniref:ABC transporter permease n=1 Tax=unclassified Vibrio TaxID=2614977 RepID=UPI000A93C812|nr:MULTISPECIES: iron chelate uptake ABC transporter family permease subunit [unclassified Vibrio]
MIILTALLALVSLLLGAGDLSQDLQLLWLSRWPRTAALLLSGVALAVAGMLMQLITRNKFVEPTTTGTTEWAALALLAIAIFNPQMSILAKILIACAASFVGAIGFMWLIQRVSLRSTVVVPLIGMMYAAVIGAVVSFFAYQFDLLQSIMLWLSGDFSAVIQGRYEVLWLTLFITILAYLFADRFTMLTLGKEMSTNLGLNYQAYYYLALAFIAAIVGLTVVTVGAIPFLGLVVPNIIRLKMGDNLRNSLPLLALSGAGLVLLCDIIGRLVIYPYEISVSVIMGVLGSVIFIQLLLNNGSLRRG